MTALPKQHYTLEEYLELDKNSEERYEFFEGAVRGVGEVFAMAGGSINHGRIMRNIIQHLRQPDNKWLRSETSGLEASVTLETLAVSLTLKEIYQRVNFQAAPGAE